MIDRANFPPIRSGEKKTRNQTKGRNEKREEDSKHMAAK
jgi:hypothetical protein